LRNTIIGVLALLAIAATGSAICRCHMQSWRLRCDRQGRSTKRETTLRLVGRSSHNWSSNTPCGPNGNAISHGSTNRSRRLGRRDWASVSTAVAKIKIYAPLTECPLGVDR
jgi:hypothetical protein